MCIIVVKPSYQEPPTKDVLEICFNDNSDGAGYSFWDEVDRQWVSEKPFITFEHFWQHYSEDRKQFGLDTKAVIFHFRIATSGPLDGTDCHPFPLEKTDTLSVYTKGVFKSSGVVAHNGVWGVGDDNMSDTQECIDELISPLTAHLKDGHIPDDLDKLMNNLLRTKSNKWVVAREDKMDLYGDWILDNGIYYSNDRYIYENTYGYAKEVSRSNARSYHSNWNYNQSSGYYQYGGTGTTSSLSRNETNRAIIINMPSNKQDALLFCDEEGFWDWEKWDLRYESPKQEVDSKAGAVYDEHGNIVWYFDDVDDDEEEDDEYFDSVEDSEENWGNDIQCKTCGLNMVEADLNDGECPGCGSLLIPKQELHGSIYDDGAICPVCSMTKCRIGDSDIPTIRGVDLFRECDYCSAVFGTIVDGGSVGDSYIVGYRNAVGELIRAEDDRMADDAN